MSKTVKFGEWECELKLEEYYNGNKAIYLFDKETGELVTVATVNLEEVLPEGQVYIKDYSENEGMLEALVKAGVVSEPISYVPSGFVIIPVCKLLL